MIEKRESCGKVAFRAPLSRRRITASVRAFAA
jgi:hypothetical protein